jgi:hypothetical protein
VDFSTAFFIVDKTGPDTLRLELALVQLVPSKADLNAVENMETPDISSTGGAGSLWTS